jgi:hypothetical protein
VNDFTFGAIAGGLIGAAWSRVQQLLRWVTGLLIVRVEVSGSRLALAMEWYCWTHLRHTRSPFYHYEGLWVWVRSEDRARTIVTERARSAQLFWRGWRPLMLTPAQERKDANAPRSVNRQAEDGELGFSFIRGTLNADRLVQEVLAAHEDHLRCRPTAANRRFAIARFSGMGGMRSRMGGTMGDSPTPYIPPLATSADVRGRVLGVDRLDVGDPLVDGEPLARIALSEEAQLAVTDIRRWAKSRAWYRARQIAWRRGLLLHGAPGTGKSSLVRGLAQELDWPVCVFDLSTMSNNELGQHWQSACSLNPCVVLIEDLDAVFDGRQNILGEQGGGLTFDCLLNVLSGVGQVDGVLVVVTTNRRRSLDPALAGGADNGPSRPGRIDLVVEMGPPDADGRALIARNILVDRPELQARMVSAGEGLSGAQFQEMCINAALTDYWANHVSIACGAKNPLITTQSK